MSEGRRTVAGGVAALARHLASAAAGIVVVPMVARALGADGLGAWAVLATASFLLGVSDLGVSTVVQRAALRGDAAGARRAVELAHVLVALGSPPLAALAALFALPASAAAGLADLGAATALTLGGGLAAAWAMPLRGLLVARGAFRPLATARVVASVTQVALTGAGLALRPTLASPAGALAASLAVELALTMRAARALDPDVPLRPRTAPGRGELRAALVDGSASLAINLSSAAALRFDVFVLAHAAPLSVVAVYGVATRAVDQAYTIAKQIGTALLPRLGRADERAWAVRTGTGALGALAGAGMAALALAGRPLLVAWAGPAADRPELVTALLLLGAASAVTGTHEVAASALTLGGRTAWRGATPIALGNAVNAAFSWAFVGSLGVAAVAGGTLLGALVTAAGVWSRARALLGWSRRSVADAVAPAVAGALSSAAVAAAAAPAGPLAALVACGVATGTGLGTAWLTARWTRTPSASVSRSPGSASREGSSATPTISPAASGPAATAST